MDAKVKVRQGPKEVWGSSEMLAISVDYNLVAWVRVYVPFSRCMINLSQRRAYKVITTGCWSFGDFHAAGVMKVTAHRYSTLLLQLSEAGSHRETRVL